MPKHFGLYLDNEWDELWHVVEDIQDGGARHRVAFRAETAEEAARIMAERLAPHIAKRMYESDEDGRPIEWRDERLRAEQQARDEEAREVRRRQFEELKREFELPPAPDQG